MNLFAPHLSSFDPEVFERIGLSIGTIALGLFASIAILVTVKPIESKTLLADVLNRDQVIEGGQTIAAVTRQTGIVLGDSDATMSFDSPSTRLAVMQTFIEKIRPLASQQGQQDLDRILLYYQDNPSALTDVGLEATSSGEMLLASKRIKAELATPLFGTQSAVLQRGNGGSELVGRIGKLLDSSASDSASINVTGELQPLITQTLLGGGLFKLTDSTEQNVYFFYCNPAKTARFIDQPKQVSLRFAADEQ